MVNRNDPGEARVGVYIDFDNIVISRFDQLHGRNSFHRKRIKEVSATTGDEALREQVEQATVDVGAVLDYAASFGTPVISKAYADWSVPVNAGYRRQLLGRAVDLTQLFPTTRGIKNGADIRLAVDVVEDLFRLPDLTHVVIVAGDSDYIALAQRAKRLGRFVVGIGVAGSTSKSLAAACDEFADYDDLPGVERPEVVLGSRSRGGKPRASEATSDSPEKVDAAAEDDQEHADVREEEQAAAGSGARSAKNGRGKTASGTPRSKKRATRPVETAVSDDVDPDDVVADEGDEIDEVGDVEEAAASLLARALRVAHAKDDDEWLHANVVKSQMKRMDPSFNEKALGYRTFSDFVSAHPDLAQMREEGQARLLRRLGD